MEILPLREILNNTRNTYFETQFFNFSDGFIGCFNSGMNYDVGLSDRGKGKNTKKKKSLYGINLNEL